MTIEINNNAAYGYTVPGELVGESGSITLEEPSYSSLDANLRNSTDYALDWRPRDFEAYRRQNKAFLEFVNTGIFPGVGADTWVGYCAAVVATAGVKALASGSPVSIEMIDKPATN